ncbi:LysE family translocator [Streptomyces sp. HNM0574]|uniref:LysE family translocator n=1 Tax=Streptomyces sp. HNM0574 TaxID=2714954 RepID=UPI00146A3974|nr:LysE family translocator [Streptomyces sp. HNM0574]NLU70324.1 LysE family translocator [Streptomyces sp. HNM0574]
MLSMLLTFLGVSLVLTAMPGPDTLLVVRSGLRGRAEAFAVGAGTAVSALAWGVAAAFGLAVVLQQSAVAFTVVKIAGAAYLLWLGAHTLWNARRSARAARKPDGGSEAEAPAEPSAGGPAPASGSAWSGLRTGLIAGILNPKTGLFYVAVLPQVLPKDAPVLSSTLLFAVVDAAVVVAYMAVLASLAALLLPYLRRPKILRNAERVTGVSLIGLGAHAAVE